MPYLHATHAGAKAREFATCQRPFGLGMTEEQAKDIETIRHIASDFSDRGDDWNAFECYDAKGKLIARRQESGY